MSQPDTDNSEYRPLRLGQRLADWFSSVDRVIVAYSGGVDSTLVLKAAAITLGPEKVIAVIGVSPSLAPEELDGALDLAESLTVGVIRLPTDEFSDPVYLRNDGQRCFACKRSLFTAMTGALEAEGTALHAAAVSRGGAWVIVDGTNADDLHDVRPGHRAAAEFNVRHPLSEAGFTKADVRALSRWWNLPTWNKPEMACLASRVAEGVAVSSEKLEMVSALERALRTLGATGARVRYHELVANSANLPLVLARIELQTDDMELLHDPANRLQLIELAKAKGFHYITLDIEGYRKGGRPAAQGQPAPPIVQISRRTTGTGGSDERPEHIQTNAPRSTADGATEHHDV